MATLEGLQKEPRESVPTGIPLNIYPASLAFDVVIERALDVAGVPGTFAAIARVQPPDVKFTYVDERTPIAGQSFWYRIYHAAFGFNNSARSPAVLGSAVPLDGIKFKTFAPVQLYGTLDTQVVARTGHGVFYETFELDPVWTIRDGTGVVTYPSDGQAGGKVLQAAGYWWGASRRNIPYDPSKLYRIRGRVRQTVAHAQDGFYLGVEGIAADGETLVSRTGTAVHTTQHYVGAAGADLSAEALNTWQEFTGWFKGWAATGASAPSLDPRAPAALHTNVRYIRPLAVLNYLSGTGTAQLDEVAIDVFDEEGMNRLYAALLSASTMAPEVGQTDGVQVRHLAKGKQRFSNVKNGDVLLFAPPYQDIPRGALVSGGISAQPLLGWDGTGTRRMLRGSLAVGSDILTITYGTLTADDTSKPLVVYSLAGVNIFGSGLGGTFLTATTLQLPGNAPTAVTSGIVFIGGDTQLGPLDKPVYPEVEFQSLSAAGSTISAKLRQKGDTVLTERIDNFGAGTLDAVADTPIEANLTNAPAIDDRYLVRFSVSISATMPLIKSPSWFSIDATIAVDSNDGLGGGWVNRDTYNVAGFADGYGDTFNDSINYAKWLTVAGLVTNSDWRIRITALSTAGNPSGSGSVVVAPEDVRYNTGTSTDQFANMTPEPEDGLVIDFEDAG